MARVATLSRYQSRRSTTADRPGPAVASPFRSPKALHRIRAARAMVAKREAELKDLRAALEVAETPKMQRILATRLLATTNNLQSWHVYLLDAERVTTAVIIP